MNIEFRSLQSGTLLRGRLEGIEPHSGGPLVIFLTGDSRNGTNGMSWKIFPEVMKKAGLGSFLFDFEGLGNSEGDRKNLTLSRAVDNFKSAFDYLLRNGWRGKNLFALGTSLGGTVLLNSTNETNQLAAIGLRSPASFLPDAYYNEISLEEFRQWQTKGYSASNGYNYNVFENALTFNSFRSARRITTPTLITHGDKDAIVPFQHSLYLYTCLGGEKKIELFEGAEHSYSGDIWYQNADSFVDWFLQHKQPN
ncbi:alpha/beta hydrolase [candidate division KSB1 bacterium]|nr:alpha/beta hydrolase [candidate division KSB1 bacterium]